MREKKYTRTVAVRLTADEWELLDYDIKAQGLKNATAWFRIILEPQFRLVRAMQAQDAKRAEAAAKRAAKKAAANVNA